MGAILREAAQIMNGELDRAWASFRWDGSLCGFLAVRAFFR